MADKTTVDVLSLEDFQGTLAARLGEAEAVLHKLNSELRGRSPAFGGFADASDKAQFAELNVLGELTERGWKNVPEGEL